MYRRSLVAHSVSAGVRSFSKWESAALQSGLARGHAWVAGIYLDLPARFRKRTGPAPHSRAIGRGLSGRAGDAIAQDGESVTATAVDDSGLSRQIRGRFLIGADGGNSIVREALGVAY